MTTTFRKTSAIVWTKDPSPISTRAASAVAFASDLNLMVRNVQGYAFESPQANVALRNIQGYAFESVKQSLNLSVTGNQALYALINNNSLYQSWSASNSTLGAPVVDNSVTNCNTRVNLAAKTASGYSGNINLYYNRRPISDAINTSVSLGTIASNTDVWTLLPTINSKYGTNLTTSDVLNASVSAGATTVMLTVASGSYMFVPGSVVAAGLVKDLASVTPSNLLFGFDNAAGNGPKATKTVMLLHFEGGSIVDTSGNFTPTIVSTAALTTQQAKFGTQCLSLPASGSALKFADDPRLRFTSDCTLEAWVMSTNNAQNGVLFGKDPSSGSPPTELQYFNGSWRVWLDSATVNISATSGVAVNTWMHIALVRYSGVWYLYQNGVLLGQFTGGTFGNNTNPFYVGNWGGLANEFQTYVDEVRISNVARYTAPFTPPATAFALD
jgi:hypothetical protein